jgi:hypothetical protein
MTRFALLVIAGIVALVVAVKTVSFAMSTNSDDAAIEQCH